MCSAIVLTDLGTSLKFSGNTQEGFHVWPALCCICSDSLLYTLIFFYGLPWYVLFNCYSNSQPSFYNLGVVYSEMLQYDSALGCYEKADALEAYTKVYFNMGCIYGNRGDLEMAINCYDQR